MFSFHRNSVFLCLFVIINEIVCKDGSKIAREETLSFVGLTLVIVWILYIVSIVLKSALFPTKNQIETQIMPILCTFRNFRHQYVILFRVGCPSESFQWKDTTIDIELLGSNGNPMGPMVRFSAARLKDQTDAVMKILMVRLTPITKLEAFRISHSGPKGTKIFLFWVKVYELKGFIEKEVQFVKIFDSIESKVKTFVEHKAEKPVVYPPTPTPRLNFWEKMAISFFVISLIESISMFCLTFTEFDETLVWIGVTVAVTSGITLFLLSIYYYSKLGLRSSRFISF